MTPPVKEAPKASKGIDTQDTVSIIVPTYNRSGYIRECLDSLLKQSLPACEIIVVDDGSTDNTAAIVQSYGDRITYLHKENEGKPVAVNLALSQAKGTLIWIFDDDDVALPNAIETRVNLLESHPEAAFVYTPHHLGFDGDDGKISRDKLHPTPVYDDESFFYELLKDCFFHLATCLVRAEAYREVGPFDAQLLGSEDYDMQIRLARKFQGVYSPEPTFIFRQHAGTRGAKKIRYSAVDRARVFGRYNKIIGQKILTQLQLGDYLCPPSTSQLSKQDELQALLNRISVMASKGCMDQMLDDLASFFQKADGIFTPLQESQLLSTMTMRHAFAAIRSDWPEFKKRLRQVKQTPGAEKATHALAKGLFRYAKSYPGSFSDRLTRLRMAIAVALT